MSLGSKLNELRILKDLKQEQIANDLEISQSTYYWENNISIPKRDNLLKLAEYFDVDINQLEEEVYRIKIRNKENAIALINSPNSKINSTQAIIKISDSLEKLTLLVEKLIEKK